MQCNIGEEQPISAIPQGESSQARALFFPPSLHARVLQYAPRSLFCMSLLLMREARETACFGFSARGRYWTGRRARGRASGPGPAHQAMPAARLTGLANDRADYGSLLFASFVVDAVPSRLHPLSWYLGSSTPPRSLREAASAGHVGCIRIPTVLT